MQSLAECLEDLAQEYEDQERRELADLIWTQLYAQYQDKAPRLVA